MVSVTLIEHGGAEHRIEARAGLSLMRAAIDNGVPGIEAICGGGCACATCHVYVDPDWVARLKPPASDEVSLLEFTIEPRAESRLSCQIELTEALDGLVVRLPETQV